MKNLYDIYEDGIGAIASTPANTVGMGNPMLPTAEEPGTEPLTSTAGKCKKKKKQVKEGILDDIDTTIDKGDKAMEFVNWYIEQVCAELKQYAPDKDKLIQVMYKMVTINNGTVIIDISKGKHINFSFDIMVIYDKPMPSFVKTLKIYNIGRWPLHINSYISDLSSFNLEIYDDNGKSFGRVSSSFKTKGNDTIKFGNIICDTLMVVGRKATSLVLGQASIILTLDVQSMGNLTEIYDKRALHNLQKIRTTNNYIKHQLCQNGILPWGIDLYIK